jgi:hypothetical protein
MLIFSDGFQNRSENLIRRTKKKSKRQARNQLAEPRVATQRIEFRIELEKCRKWLPLV